VFLIIFSHNEQPKIFICGVSRRHHQNQGVALITGVRLPSESDHATAVRRAMEATGFQRVHVDFSLDGR
jgi:8-oxo-dGTP pyrophosphatase MutT (NUDIX family)